MEIGNIVKGHANELFGLNQDISEQRIEVCKRCPLYSNKLGGMCNDKLFLDPETGDVSTKKLLGYIQGCGCRLKAKTTLINEECPVGKW